MRSVSGVCLQHGGTLNAAPAQESENIVDEKPLFCTGISIQMDRDLNGRSIFQHVLVSNNGFGRQASVMRRSARSVALREALCCPSISSETHGSTLASGLMAVSSNPFLLPKRG